MASGGDPDMKKHVEQVKGAVEQQVNKTFTKFDAIQSLNVTPEGWVGGAYYVAEIDVGEGNDNFLHVKYVVTVGIQHPERVPASLDAVGLPYKSIGNSPGSTKKLKYL